MARIIGIHSQGKITRRRCSLSLGEGGIPQKGGGCRCGRHRRIEPVHARKGEAQTWIIDLDDTFAVGPEKVIVFRRSQADLAGDLMESSIAIGFSITERVIVAFVLAWAIGYERHFNGRASGGQVYCLVCMAACALTAATGYSSSWFGGGLPSTAAQQMNPMGSILTGIGFLGAGIIVKSGMNIRGLTTAASIWSSSAIGILVGIDFYVAAVALTVLFIACMVVVPRVERYLPARSALAVTLRYRDSHHPSDEIVDAFMEQRGLLLQNDSVAVTFGDGKFAMEFTILATSLMGERMLSILADELPQIPHVESFSIARINRA